MTKKTMRFFTVLALAMMSLTFIACGGDEPDDPTTIDPTNPIDPVTPTADKAMSPLQQKEYLEKIALEFIDKSSSSNFSTVNDLLQYCYDTYGEDYDWDAVDEWAKDVLDDTRNALGNQVTETHEYSDYGYTYIYNDIYNMYESVLMASNFTGHFTAANGRWTVEKADDLQIIFNDRLGRQCVIKLETKGKVKKVFAFNYDDWVDYEWSEMGNTYVSNEYYDRVNCTIGVPEQAIVTLTQAGKQILKVTVNLDFSSLEGDNFDISKSAFTASYDIEFDNGYRMTSSDVTYKGNKSASTTFVMSRNGETIIAVGCSGDIKDLPSRYLNDLDDEDFDTGNAKNVYVSVDILGKMQVQGTISDCRKYVDYLDNALDNDQNESLFRSYINQANSLTDVNLFYDLKSTKQATIRLEPFVDEGWNGEKYWTIEPVICFYDGSSYSTIEAFFNNRDFRQTVDSFKSFVNQYAYLLGSHIYW